MTDTPLLRLARALLDGAEGHATFDETTDRMRSLVRDLEAAPPPETERPPSPVETALREFAGFISGDIPELHSVEVPRIAESVSRYLNAAGPHVPPEPARRTITREEFNAAKTDLFAELVDDARTWAAATDKERMMCHNMATHCAYAWRLTVEDA